MNTPEKGATMKEIRRVHAEGRLPAAAELFMADRKPIEELYGLENDPHEIDNLASDPRYSGRLTRMREVHLEWVRQTKDLGLIPEPELLEREKRYGSRYAILRQPGGDALSSRLGRIAALASEGKGALGELITAMDDEDAAIRYWGATGIGNIGADAQAAAGKMTAALQDQAVSVKVAAARALCMMGRPRKALPVLVAALRGEDTWGRLQAAIVLDSIGEQARAAEGALKAALTDQTSKYITRVANHALNVLNGTDNVVK